MMMIMDLGGFGTKSEGFDCSTQGPWRVQRRIEVRYENVMEENSCHEDR